MSSANGKAEPCDPAYQQYLERKNYYYPDRTTLTFEQFQFWDAKWHSEYVQLWTNMTAWMKANSSWFDFAEAPQWPEIKKLEEMLCL